VRNTFGPMSIITIGKRYDIVDQQYNWEDVVFCFIGDDGLTMFSSEENLFTMWV
jgi:hypothetical protein